MIINSPDVLKQRGDFFLRHSGLDDRMSFELLTALTIILLPVTGIWITETRSGSSKPSPLWSLWRREFISASRSDVVPAGE